MNWLPKGSAPGRPVWWWGIAMTVAAVLALFGGFGVYLLTHLPGDPAASSPEVVNTPDSPAPVMTPIVAAVVATATAEATVAPPTELPSPTPTPPPPTDTPAPTPTPMNASDRLALGMRLHRLGDTVAARGLLASLAAEPSLDTQVRWTAQTYLARGYVADGEYGQALAVLDQLAAELAALGDVAPAFDPTLPAKVAYLRGETLAALGRAAEAIEVLNALVAANPALTGAVQTRLAQTFAAQGDLTSAATAYRAAADAATETAQRAALLELLAETYRNLGRYAESVAAYDEILGVAVIGKYRALIQYYAGEVLALAGDQTAAIERWRAATEEAPDSETAHDALVRLVAYEAEFDLYDRGAINLAVESWLPAINAFTLFLDGAPGDDPRYAAALHGLGQAYLGAGNTAAATQVLNRVIAEFPACACFGEAWLDLARTEAAQGNGTAARRTYRTFARDYVQDPLAPEALWRSGWSALAEGNAVEAAVDFLALADLFPAGERAPQALYTVGLGAYINGLYVEGADALRRLQTDYPNYRWDATGYWLGRALQAQGDGAGARAAWQGVVDRAPDIYYGVLSAQAMAGLGTSGGAMVAAANVAAVAGPPSRLAGDNASQAFAEAWLAQWLGVDAATLPVLPPEIGADPDLATGRLLVELDERGVGLAALERVYARNRENPAALYALSLEYERLGAYRLSLLAMSQLLALSPAGLVENSPIFLQQRVYPQRFADLIIPEAEAHGIDPLLLFSLIRQESLFEEGARSVAAAQGLAQIIPATGQEVADRMGYPGYTNALVYRPYINIKFGAFYLDWVRDYLDGNLVSAMVGYNAGPGRSDTWRENFGADDALFVEQLTIEEPRVYIRAIVGNLYHYTRLYGGG